MARSIPFRGTALIIAGSAGKSSIFEEISGNNFFRHAAVNALGEHFGQNGRFSANNKSNFSFFEKKLPSLRIYS